MIDQVLFQPLFPAWLVLLLGTLLAALVVRRYHNHFILMANRLIVVVVLTFMLANPQQVHQVVDGHQASVLLLVDRSGSMGVADVTGRTETRLEVARDIQLRMQEKLQESWLVSQGSFVNRLYYGASDQAAEGPTNFMALAEMAGGGPVPDVACIISDGADWKQSSPEVQLRQAGITVHSLGIGAPGSQANAVVRLTSASPTAFPGQELPLQLAVTANQVLHGRRAQVVVEAVSTTDGTVMPVLQQQITLSAFQQVPVLVHVGEHNGLRLWRARLEQLVDEIDHEDNVAHAAVQVSDRTMSVLVCEGRPVWDTTFLLRALRRDQQMLVATRFALGDKTYDAITDADQPMPGLAEVGTVVLGRDGLDLLDGKDTRLYNWVRDGGHLVLFNLDAESIAQTSFDEVVPITLRKGVIEVSAEQVAAWPRKRTLTIGDRISKKLTMYQQQDLAPQTEVLLGTSEQTAFARRRFGNGLITQVNAQGFWRWQLGDKAKREVVERLWRQLVKHSAAGSGVLQADRLRYRVGDEAVVAYYGSSEAEGTVRVETPEGRVVSLRPDDQQLIRIPLSELGLWKVQWGEQSTILVVESTADELVLIDRDDQRLHQLTAATAGTHRDWRQWASLCEELTIHSAMHSEQTQVLTPLIVKPHWLVLIGLLLSIEWYFRRRRYGGV